MSISEHDIALSFEFIFKPLLLKLYEEAELDIPVEFNYEIECERLVASFREQGYSTKFKTRYGRVLG